MELYTAAGIARQEQESENPAKQQLFELVGIVVHSGQASAGHYYSFIKEKQYVLFLLFFPPPPLLPSLSPSLPSPHSLSLY